MSICLTVKVHDPEVEGLLGYLQAQKCTDSNRIYLLNRALAWYRAMRSLETLDQPEFTNEYSIALGDPCGIAGERE